MSNTDVRVQVPPRAPGKDAYFDTMGIEICALAFCPKPLKIADFITLLRKAPPLTWQKAGPEAVLLCFFRVRMTLVNVELWAFVILLGLSLSFSRFVCHDFDAL